MPNKPLTLADVSAFSEDESRAYLERIRWPNGPVCPHCGSLNARKLEGKSTRHGAHKCRDCRKQFTVTVGSVFRRSHIPLRKWVIAFHLMCGSKKGISAMQLQRHLGLKSYQSAWHMAHRIRHAMADLLPPDQLAGEVEVDETYVGGKPRKGGSRKRADGTRPDRPKSKRGRGTTKAPVVALVERNGRARALAVADVTSKTLRSAIDVHVSRDAGILTDELPAYLTAAAGFAGGHRTVTHSVGQYADGASHTNTVESYFALMKRGITGAYHSVSRQHLQRYCDEFSFRWDHRRVSDGIRVETAVRKAGGKRLTYK